MFAHIEECNVIFPEVNKTQILNDLDFGHFRTVKTKSLNRRFSSWPGPGINKDIENLAHNCFISVNLKYNLPKVETRVFRMV